MTVELLKKSYKYRQIVAQTTTAHEETAEAIVPDAFADIERIVDASALVFIREKDAQTDQADLRVNVRVTVLYIPEGGGGLQRLEIPLAFSHRVELRGARPGSDIMCTVRPAALDCRAPNPRKVSVKASIVFETRAYGDAQLELTDGIDGEDAGAMQILKKSALISRCAVTAAKNFTLVEELEAPEGATSVKEILKNEVEVTLDECRQMAGKSMLRGQAAVNCLYEDTDGGYARMTLEIPFSQIVDAPGADAQMDGRAVFELRSFEMSPSVDMTGDVKHLTVSLGLGASVMLYDEQEVEILSDLYSLSHDVKPVTAMKSFTRCAPAEDVRSSVNEHIEAGMRVRKILDWSVRADNNADFTPEDGTATFAAFLTVLYVGDEDGIFSLSRRLPVAVAMPDYRAGTVQAAVREAHISPDSDGNINARFTLVLSRDVEQSAAVPMITELELGEELDAAGMCDTNGDRFSAVLRFADANDDLWSIAKCYHTTTAEIRSANRLEPDAPLEQGRLLLIPLAR